MAGHIHSLLEASGIDSYLKNINLTGGIGELPINECWPEVWVINDSDYDAANEIIEATLAQAKIDQNWDCQCGESIEGQFAVCWACGYEKP